LRILYVAPVFKRYNAMRTETHLAVEDGHEVHLVADHRAHQGRGPIDERVRVHWMRPGEVRAPESGLVNLALRRAPRGVLRRLARGPFTQPANRVLRWWNRTVVRPLERGRKRRARAMREAYPRGFVMGLIEAERIDWLVLGEPDAVDLLADDLAGLLARRPDLRTTHYYEGKDPAAAATPPPVTLPAPGALSASS